MADEKTTDKHILDTISKTFIKDLAQEIVSVQPMNINVSEIYNWSKTTHDMQICIYSNLEQYNDTDSWPSIIIRFKAKRDNVARMITETAVECKIDIEMQKTSFNTWRILTNDVIFQSIFKLKYG